MIAEFNKRKLMKVKIKRFDKTLVLPAYKTSGAAALDLASREEVKIEAGQVAYLPLNIALQIPKDSFVRLHVDDNNDVIKNNLLELKKTFKHYIFTEEKISKSKISAFISIPKLIANVLFPTPPFC